MHSRPQSYGVIRCAFPPSKLRSDPPSDPKYRYLQCSRTLGSPNIAIYSVPAPWAPQISLFTVFPHPGLPKYHYLQCSRPCPGGVAQVWVDMGGHWWIWVDMGGYGWIWVDMGRYGWIWVDIGRKTVIPQPCPQYYHGCPGVLSRPQSYHVSLFTVIPHPEMSKYRYLQ